MKNIVIAGIGVIGGWIAYGLGGFDTSVVTLLLFMLCDYVTGLLVAGVFHKSKKTQTGTLESRAGFKGLLKKGVVLLLVMVANRLDIQLGLSVVRDGVCIAFITNELISIIENAGLMGLPIPTVLTNAIDLLKGQEVKKHENIIN